VVFTNIGEVNLGESLGKVCDAQKERMTERENTLVCTFDPQSHRITAYDIHEWIQETMHLEGTDVAMVQVDGPRHVYINSRNTGECKRQSCLQTDRGICAIRTGSYQK
jgi:hypothetical protein